MFKELVFEMTGAAPREAHGQRVFQRDVNARVRVIHATPATCWELVHAEGRAKEVTRLKQALTSGTPGPMRDAALVAADANELQYVVRWESRDDLDACTALPILLHEVAGSDALFASRLSGNGVEVTASARDGGKLLDYFNAACARLPDVSVRFLRAGAVRGELEVPAPPGPRGVNTQDRDLIALALAAGYYDNPKRCGVRDLGDALGCSKSVIARRLRNIERTALESFVGTEPPVVSESRKPREPRRLVHADAPEVNVQTAPFAHHTSQG